MTSERDDDLTPAERELLAALRSGVHLPASLEERTLAALRREGLTADAEGAKRVARRWPVHARWAAAALLLFAAGHWTGTRGFEEDRAGKTRHAYLLLLKRDSAEDVSPEEHRRRVAEYAAWARALGDRLVDGAELADTGLLLGGEPPGTAIRLDARERGDHVAGYFLIAVDTDEEAAAIARTCPHLLYDGRIELRRVQL